VRGLCPKQLVHASMRLEGRPRRCPSSVHTADATSWQRWRWPPLLLLLLLWLHSLQRLLGGSLPVVVTWDCSMRGQIPLCSLGWVHAVRDSATRCLVTCIKVVAGKQSTTTIVPMSLLLLLLLLLRGPMILGGQGSMGRTPVSHSARSPFERLAAVRLASRSCSGGGRLPHRCVSIASMNWGRARRVAPGAWRLAQTKPASRSPSIEPWGDRGWMKIAAARSPALKLEG
jgi:hypothetical protein